MTRFLVIGAGIAGTAVVRALFERLGKSVHITQVHHSTLAPSCSVSSMAVAALRGVRPGLSPLGDELIEAFTRADQVYSELSLPGMHLMEHQTIVFKDEKKLKRFSHLASTSTPVMKLNSTPALIAAEKAWGIEPAIFLKALRGSFTENYRYLEDFVTGLEFKEGVQVSFLDKRIETFDKVVVCAGAYQGALTESRQQIVQGSFFEWQADFGSRSFSVSLDEVNLVYHSAAKRLLLGATSEKKGLSFIPATHVLKDLYATAQSHLDVSLPPLGDAQIKTGLRVQGVGRKPFVGELSPGVYGINGLYKNGWILAWSLADKCVKAMGFEME